MKSDENLMKLAFHQIFIRFHQISSDFIFFFFLFFLNFGIFEIFRKYFNIKDIDMCFVYHVLIGFYGTVL